MAFEDCCFCRRYSNIYSIPKNYSRRQLTGHGAAMPSAGPIKKALGQHVTANRKIQEGREQTR